MNMLLTLLPIKMKPKPSNFEPFPRFHTHQTAAALLLHIFSHVLQHPPRRVAPLNAAIVNLVRKTPPAIITPFTQGLGYR